MNKNVLTNNLSTSPIHLISFDIPDPPDYGGIIDVYYKVKALCEVGVKVHLHCFEYGRSKSTYLETICESVQYYPRKKWWRSLPLKRPHIVSSRYADQLVKNLLRDTAPILFEGLHTCAILAHPALKHRNKLVRTHNIEHEYYWYLHVSEKSRWKQYYFLREAALLERFEKQLQFANHILPISPNDTDSIRQRFPTQHIHYIPAFHSNQTVMAPLGKGSYLLYHGNLSVNENIGVALYLLKFVFPAIKIPCFIAGKNPSTEILEEAEKYSHIGIIPNPSDVEMEKLIEEAHIHLLPTFQATGIKLKLLHALYKGRFCIVNFEMIQQTGLESLCHRADTPDEMIQQINSLLQEAFTAELKQHRTSLLHSIFDNKANAQKIVKLL